MRYLHFLCSIVYTSPMRVVSIVMSTNLHYLHILYKIHDCIDHSSSFGRCMWAAMMLMFYTFCRKSNVLYTSDCGSNVDKLLTRGNVSLCQDGFIVTLHKTKTVQYGQRKVVIPVCSIPGSRLCPVLAYLRMVYMLPVDDSLPACGYVGTSGKYMPLSDRVFVTEFRRLLAVIGVRNPQDFCTHSFRRGGTTFAFQSGVSKELIKAQGDWASDCYVKYIKLGISDKLQTTQLMSHNLMSLQ